MNTVKKVLPVVMVAQAAEVAEQQQNQVYSLECFNGDQCLFRDRKSTGELSDMALAQINQAPNATALHQEVAALRKAPAHASFAASSEAGSSSQVV